MCSRHNTTPSHQSRWFRRRGGSQSAVPQSPLPRGGSRPATSTASSHGQQAMTPGLNALVAAITLAQGSRTQAGGSNRKRTAGGEGSSARQQRARQMQPANLPPDASQQTQDASPELDVEVSQDQNSAETHVCLGCRAPVPTCKEVCRKCKCTIDTCNEVRRKGVVSSQQCPKHSCACGKLAARFDLDDPAKAARFAQLETLACDEEHLCCWSRWNPFLREEDHPCREAVRTAEGLCSQHEVSLASLLHDQL